MHDLNHNLVVLTDEEINEILLPIRDHGHCWGFIADKLLKEALARKKEALKLGPYGDWPKDGH